MIMIIYSIGIQLNLNGNAITDEHILILNWILKLRDIRADKYVSASRLHYFLWIRKPIGRLILYDETHQKWNH